MNARSGSIATALLAVCAVLSGCAQVVANPDPLPASRDSTSEYRIQPGDQMDVKFFYNPELNESIVVRPDGRISLQLANEIQAAGKTPAELTERLKAAYAEELEKPEVSVILRSFAGQQVYIDGEVNNPSVVPLSPSMTVLQSISAAGGLKGSARTTEVIVIRKSRGGEPRTFTVNLDRVVDGTAPDQDVALSPFDVVYVPRSPIANVNLWVDQYIRQNIPINFSLFYEIGNGGTVF